MSNLENYDLETFNRNRVKPYRVGFYPVSKIKEKI